MKIIISPAKSLDFETEVPTNLYTKPSFVEQSIELNETLKTLSAKKLSELMRISKDLASLNYNRNQSWSATSTLSNSKQAIFAFTGEVYRGIDVMSLEEEKLPVLQEKLRILSGLYGVLKPLDLIQPYRLEMGTKLTVKDNSNLYQFWGKTLVNSLNKEMKENELFVNLASNEYAKVIPKKELKVPMITPVFKELKGDVYKVVAVYAKKARGLMVRYIIDKNIETIDPLKGFDVNGYRFSESLSTGYELVFTR